MLTTGKRIFRHSRDALPGGQHILRTPSVRPERVEGHLSVKTGSTGLHPERFLNVKRKSCSVYRLSEDYSFPARQRPYRHQLQAWQTLIDGSSPRSALVTSGTGSGKTECFLIPILDDLATELEQRQNAPLIGARAI